MHEPQSVLVAERIALVSIPTAALAARCEAPAAPFTVATLVAPGRYADVFYPATWPGEAGPSFGALLSNRSASGAADEWIGAIVLLAERVCIGNMGTHGPPRDGTIEIGYAIEPGYRNAGYATEMLQAFVAALFARGDVDVVTAETLVANVPSQRVLEKNGFRRRGRRNDAGGEFICWDLRHVRRSVRK